MLEQLPKGKSIGWMQAPPQWIFTHTARFTGIARIVIHDGEGFILIKRGNPICYYFRYGKIELKGHSALDYFNSHAMIEFDLCKYTPDEFALAMKLCNIEEEGPQEQPGTSEAIVQEFVAGPRVPVEEPVLSPSLFEEDDEPFVPPLSVPAEKPSIVPLPGELQESDVELIGQIKSLNGIVAISVFDDERTILQMGEVDIEPVLKIARRMLATTKKISPLVDWGSFVHMTLQIAEGNVIIAPFRDFYLCLLTTRTINIGHIRRIIRDLQVTRDV